MVAGLGAVGVSLVRVADVSVILAGHGIDPDADAETLRDVLEARGWPVTVEETRVGTVRRYTAQTFRIRTHSRDPALVTMSPSVRATGATSRAALAFLLAKVLEKEREA